MFNNFINKYDFFSILRNVRSFNFSFISAGFRSVFQSKNKRIAKAWSPAPSQKPQNTNSDDIYGAGWVGVPAIRKYISQIITGQPSEEYPPYPAYVMQKCFQNRGNLRALVLGCGGSFKIIKWAQTGQFSRIDAYDLSAPMIKRVAEETLDYPEINPIVGDVFSIPIQEHYDLIIAEHSLHHFSPLRDIFIRIRKMIHPTGFFVIDEFVGPTKFQWTQRQIDISRALLTLLPEKYRIRDNGTIKQPDHIYRPSKLAMFINDPSEAIESSNILPLLKDLFDIVEIKPYCGTCLAFVFNEISQNFRTLETQEIANIYLKIEESLIENGDLVNDYIFAICKV